MPSIRDRIRWSSQWSLGLFFLGLVVVLWVLSSFLLNGIFEHGAYSKPFFITWINTTSFAFYLLPYYFGQPQTEPIECDKDPDLEEALDEAEQHGTSPLIVTPSRISKPPPLTVAQTIKLSFWFCILWFTSNLLNNASLMFTSVSSQTILASTSSFFTILVGYFGGIENLSHIKIISLILSFVGVVLVAGNDDPTSSGTDDPGKIVWGNLLTLGGALCYSVYSILLKREVKEDWRMDMRLFFGWVGVFNLLFLWPPIILMDKLGYETFELPPTKTIYIVIVVNCLTSFLADFLWARAMLLTTPLTVTVGLSMTIPVAMLGDLVFKFKWNSPIYTLGAILVCISFYLINKDEESEHGE